MSDKPIDLKELTGEKYRMEHRDITASSPEEDVCAWRKWKLDLRVLWQAWKGSQNELSVDCHLQEPKELEVQVQRPEEREEEERPKRNRKKARTKKKK